MYHKIIPIGSWPRMPDVAVNLVKVSSRGLRGQDLKHFLEKLAAAPAFADYLSEVKLEPGDLPIHIIGMGATEYYLANRNGDGFNVENCKYAAPTFVGGSKYNMTDGARYYYDHANRDPHNSYGYIKAAAYNERMGRVELLAIGNANKQAAERNHGHAMPQRDVDALYRGELLPHSMSCTLAYDVCANCFNKAANRRFYCTEATCINPDTGRQGFGCASGMTKVASDGIVQYVENPFANMRDMSRVRTQADRTAYGGLADYLQKAASAADTGAGGWELADLYDQANYGCRLLTPQESRDYAGYSAQADCLRELLTLEGSVADGERLAAELPVSLSAPIADAWLHAGEKAAQQASRFHQAGLLLTLPDFLRLHADNAKAAAAAPSIAACLPQVFRTLTAEPEQLTRRLRDNPYYADTPSLLPAELFKYADWHGTQPRQIQHRLFAAAMRQYPTPSLPSRDKRASANGDALQAAQDYAIYQLAYAASRPVGERSQACRVIATRNAYQI